MDAEHFVEFGARTVYLSRIEVVDDHGQRELAEVVPVELDFLDAFTEFPDLRLLRIIEEHVLRGSVIHVDLAKERSFGVMEVAAFSLDVPPGLAGVFLLPFGDDVIVGLHFKEAFEDEGKALGGRLFQRQDLNVVVVHAQMAAVAFELRFAKIVVEERIVLESCEFDLVRVEVERFLENTEHFLLAENAYRQKVADLENETSSLLKKSGLGFGDVVPQDEYLFFREEVSGQFGERLPGLRSELRKRVFERV